MTIWQCLLDFKTGHEQIFIFYSSTGWQLKGYIWLTVCAFSVEVSVTRPQAAPIHGSLLHGGAPPLRGRQPEGHKLIVVKQIIMDKTAYSDQKQIKLNNHNLIGLSIMISRKDSLL